MPEAEKLLDTAAAYFDEVATVELDTPQITNAGLADSDGLTRLQAIGLSNQPGAAVQ